MISECCNINIISLRIMCYTMPFWKKQNCSSNKLLCNVLKPTLPATLVLRCVCKCKLLFVWCGPAINFPIVQGVILPVPYHSWPPRPWVQEEMGIENGYMDRQFFFFCCCRCTTRFLGRSIIGICSDAMRRVITVRLSQQLYPLLMGRRLCRAGAEPGIV